MSKHNETQSETYLIKTFQWYAHNPDQSNLRWNVPRISRITALKFNLQHEKDDRRCSFSTERLGDVRGAGLSFRPLPSPVPTFISHSLQSSRRNRINDAAIVDKLMDLTIWEEFCYVLITINLYDDLRNVQKFCCSLLFQITRVFDYRHQINILNKETLIFYLKNSRKNFYMIKTIRKLENKNNLTCY